MADTTRSHLIRLGIFTILGVAVFAALVFMFKPAVAAIRGGLRVKMHLTYAGEIRTGTPVRYLGISAGEVVDVAYAAPQTGGVDVTILLRREAGVRNDPKARPYVDTKMTGESYIEFPQADPAAPLLEDGDTIEGTYRQTIPDLVARLADLSSTLDATALEFKAAAADIRDGVDSVGVSFTKVSERAADLLEHRPIDDPNRPPKRNISTVVQRLDKVLESADSLLGDKKMQQDVKDAVASLRETSERLARAAADAEAAFKKVRTVADRSDTLAVKLEQRLDQIGTVIDTQNTNLNNVARSVLETAEGMSGVLAIAQRILNDVSEGKGVLGRLLADDPALFEELLRTVAQANQSLRAAEIVFKELLDHPGDYMTVGKRRTSEDERKARIEELRKMLREPNP